IQDALLPTDRIANGSLFTVGGNGYLVFGEKTISGGNLPSNELWQFTPGTTGLAEEVDAFGLVAFGGADGVISVRSTRPMDALATVRLLDASGAVLSEINAHGPLNMRIGSDLPSGVYLVQVSSAVAAHTLRVALVR
ncbi:MAG: T9SS type A sorting domain-containing protein, partial [Flavobacteriales bacterium]|nr:T9SS type A sorting domain-containing protein [Flavobacteriales bacterium]